MPDSRDILHRYLDGEMTAEERQAFLRRMDADPALKKEHDALANSLRMLGASPRMAAPPSFTRDVMKRLPPKPVPLVVRLRDFLLRGRVLRWNMATALAAAAVLVIAVAVVYRPGRVPVETALAPTSRESTATIRLNFYAPQARQVTVAGDFNKWQVDATKMDRRAGGVWSVEIKLRPGVYNYMFVVDGKAWVTDPDAESYQDDGFGARNAVMRVKT